MYHKRIFKLLLVHSVLLPHWCYNVYCLRTFTAPLLSTTRPPPNIVAIPDSFVLLYNCPWECVIDWIDTFSLFTHFQVTIWSLQHRIPRVGSQTTTITPKEWTGTVQLPELVLLVLQVWPLVRKCIGTVLTRTVSCWIRCSDNWSTQGRAGPER